MISYLLRRLPSAILVLFLASVLIFAVLRLVPGDPATTLAGVDATAEAIAQIRHNLGLDRPVAEQYLTWIRGVVTGELGTSYTIGGKISSLIAHGAVNTLILTGAALALTILISLITACVWVWTKSKIIDSIITGFNTIALGLPTFVTGIVLVLIFGILLPILPAGGTPPKGFADRIDISAQYLLMPALCLALPASAGLTRFLAESLRTELHAPYITTARAAGVSERRLLAHALPAALPTYLTALGIHIGGLLGGAVLVEAVFTWPGLGQLIAQAIDNRDYPVVQILLLISVGVFIVIQLITDAAHAALDPRIRIGG
ncbi:ABC transporter permease [Microlunatus elymi]|uniref:ABC transporter permease n=1 Tax=Microlunatus elymi TaxID=2596828 RepID=A0A516Q3S5_9ACTN|nr:ABC transporter permease [Microlunatus elymi]QDP98078.1 ABC transporter permease [Microlunatus elymi]